MTWWRTEPGHQQPCYWLCWAGLIWSLHSKGLNKMLTTSCTWDQLRHWILFSGVRLCHRWLPYHDILSMDHQGCTDHRVFDVTALQVDFITLTSPWAYDSPRLGEWEGSLRGSDRVLGKRSHCFRGAWKWSIQEACMAGCMAGVSLV